MKHNIDEKKNLISKYAFCDPFKRVAIIFEEKMNEFYRKQKDLNYFVKKEKDKRGKDNGLRN